VLNEIGFVRGYGALHSVGEIMTTLTIPKSELEEMIKNVIVKTLTERSDLLENAVAEAILDMKLGLAMEEGDTGEYVDESHIISRLKD
jgi:hypothetical protein